MELLTQNELKLVLNYNPETGIFTWIVNKGKIKIGDIAGCLNPKGYLKIKINYNQYFAHRLAFLYMTGEWPKEQIDHININKSDNRWCNLREANNGQNQSNALVYKSNKIGIKGVRWQKHHKKYEARLRFNKKTMSLGYYDDVEDAAKAYKNAAKFYHKEFARWSI